MIAEQKISNPYISTIGLRSLKSDVEKVMKIDNEFCEAVRAQTNDFNLMYEAWNAYFAVDGGQWEIQKVAKLVSEERIPRSYDIISPKVDTLAGALVSELPDMDWTPVEGERTTATEAVKDSWYADKELTNSEWELMLTIRDGLVHCGWCQLIENTTYGKPVIGIQRIMPGFLVPSPYWVQESDRYLEKVFRVGYLTPEQLKAKYKSKSEEIEEAINIIKRRGHEELPANAADQRRRYVGRIADQYKVIEEHSLEHISTSRLVGVRIETNQATGEPTGHIRWMPFPITKDRQRLEHFAGINQISWETVEEVPYEDTVHKVNTICPEFDRSILLEADGKSKIQTKGLPFYHFTVTRFNGRNKGIVASMLDPQRTLNERESLISELISKANGGADLVDENVFKDDKDRANFVKNANKPGYKHFIDMSQSKTGAPVVNIGSNQYPAQILDQISRIYDRVLPMVSRVSDSMSAVTETGKSGILFEREIQINRIGNLLMDKGIKNMMDGIAEGYFLQWQISYAGIYREITSRDGKRKIKLNERFVDSNGKEMIRNAVGYVPRCRALITESTRSPTYQMRYRMIFSEILQNINPQINPEHYNYVFNKFMSTLDLPEKDKAELEAMNRMLETKTKMQYVQQIMQIHAGTKAASLEAANADAQLNMLMQQIQAAGGQPAQPAIPEQLNDAADDVVEIAGPEEKSPVAAGSDVTEV